MIRTENYLCYRGRKVFEPPRYMTVAQAAEQLLEAIDNRRKNDENDKQLKCKQQCILVSLYSISVSLSPSRFDRRVSVCGCGQSWYYESVHSQ